MYSHLDDGGLKGDSNDYQGYGSPIPEPCSLTFYPPIFVAECPLPPDPWSLTSDP